MIKIQACKESEFLKNSTFINNYFQARKSSKPNNTERLISLIEVYFKTLLYYIKHSRKLYLVTLADGTFELKINGFDEKGSPVQFDIIKAGHPLIRDVFSDLYFCMNLDWYEKLQKLILKILNTDSIPIDHKISILNHESESFSDHSNFLMYRINERVANDTLLARIGLIFRFFTEHSLVDDVRDESLFKSYENSLKYYLRNCVARNHFIDGLKFIESEIERFDSIDPDIQLNEDRIVYILLNILIAYNNLFQVVSREHIKEITDEYIHLLGEEHQTIIEENISFNPSNFEINNLFVEIANPDFSRIKEEEIRTIIQFVVKIKTGEDNYIVNQDDAIVEIKDIQNLFDDPIYSFLDSTNMQIGGMPISVYSDTVGDISQSTLIRINFRGFYHPDFDIIENKVVFKDFQLENAAHNGKYYPHKEFILAKLFELLEDDALPIKLKKEDIVSSLISNYMVSYFHQGKKIHHKVFTITNFNSYFQAKNKYFERLNNVNFIDSNDIATLVYKYEILNQKQLLDFTYKLFELSIKKSIEIGGLHSSFWDGENPVVETEAQKVIHNLVRYIAEIKGIQFSRETVSSNGSLDFLMHYTKYDKSLRVCVELKNAHHNDLLSGVSKQLPAYIKDIGNRDGIFFVLWYKDKDFSKPSKYKTIEDLRSEITKYIPAGYRIRPLIIDCSREKTTPSNL